MILNVFSWSNRFFALYIIYRPWAYGDSWFSIELFDGSSHPACHYMIFWNWNQPVEIYRSG
jgi:hypothetical protein